MRIFAIFAIFDIAYFLLKLHQNPNFAAVSKFTQIPKFAWYNLIFTLILYAFVVAAYSLHGGKIVWF